MSSRTTSRTWRRSSAVANARNRGAPRVPRGAPSVGRGVRGGVAPSLEQSGGPYRGPPRSSEVVDGEDGLLHFVDPAIRVLAHGALDLGRHLDGLVPERA